MSNHSLINVSTKELSTYISAFSVSCTARTTVPKQLLYLQNSAERKSAKQYRYQSRTFSSHSVKFFSVYIK